MEKKIENTNTENTDKKLIISDVMQSIISKIISESYNVGIEFNKKNGDVLTAEDLLYRDLFLQNKHDEIMRRYFA